MKKSLMSLIAVTTLLGSSAILSGQDYPDFTSAAETAVEAVVYVEVTIKANQVSNQISDPFFKFFFGDEFVPQGRERKASGSGVIIRPDGYVVTNNHVIADASSIRVTLNNNKSYDATLVGADPATDIALLKINSEKLPYLRFADSDKLRIGEWVLAIGSPYDLRVKSSRRSPHPGSQPKRHLRRSSKAHHQLLEYPHTFDHR